MAIIGSFRERKILAEHLGRRIFLKEQKSY